MLYEVGFASLGARTRVGVYKGIGLTKITFGFFTLETTRSGVSVFGKELFLPFFKIFSPFVTFQLKASGSLQTGYV